MNSLHAASAKVRSRANAALRCRHSTENVTDAMQSQIKQAVVGIRGCKTSGLPTFVCIADMLAPGTWPR